MDTSSHLSLEVLTDIAEDRGELKLRIRKAAKAHLAICSACGDTLDHLRRVIRLMRSDTSEEVSPQVLSAAVNAFQPKTPPALRRVVAVLTFDSRNSPPAFGIRTVRVASHQLLYSAQESDLELRLTVQNEKCVVAGQVFRESCSGGMVEISGANGSAEASLNELCEFTLPAVPPGHYLIRVKMVDVEIEVPELELRP